MTDVRLEHFRRALVDVREHGDNDTLPFDIDARFIAAAEEGIAQLAYKFGQEAEKGTKKSAKNAIDALPVFAERLLVPTGAAGFRITTKIHPFWNIYFDGLGIAIAERLGPGRSDRVHSYRVVSHGASLFDRDRSWRAFRVATVDDCQAASDAAVVVQTDISNLYEHISHHRLENSIDDLFAKASAVAMQIDRFLSKFASGRSFGLPVPASARYAV